jgi:hypothetical protein
VAAGIAMGERPTVLALAGVLVALPAIVLVAASDSASGPASGSASGLARGLTGSGLTDGLAAGAAFGFMFIGLAQAGHVPGRQGAGLWPVASEQTGSLLLVLALAVRSRVPLRPAIRAAGWPALVGASGMSATLLYFYATHVSMLATAAVLVSLYPGYRAAGPGRAARAVQPGPAGRPEPVHPGRRRHRPQLTSTGAMRDTTPVRPTPSPPAGSVRLPVPPALSAFPSRRLCPPSRPVGSVRPQPIRSRPATLQPHLLL